MVCDPRHSVDSRLMMVDTDDDDDAFVVSGAGVFVLPVAPGVPGAGFAAFDSRDSNSPTRPFSAKGAGSTPRRVNRSDKDAKQRKAPSATCGKQMNCISRRVSWLAKLMLFEVILTLLYAHGSLRV